MTPPHRLAFLRTGVLTNSILQQQQQNQKKAPAQNTTTSLNTWHPQLFWILFVIFSKCDYHLVSELIFQNFIFNAVI